MKLILKLALRELKNARKFSYLFILNLALGVLGFVLIHSFKTSVNESLSVRSKILLGSDITISGRRNLTNAERGKINKLLNKKAQEKSSLIELYSMGKALNSNHKSRLVQIKIIDEAYPLYGHLTLVNNGNVDSNKFKIIDEVAKTWVSPELAHQMKVKIGDKIKLGEQEFIIDDIIKDDTSSSWRGVGLAPKLYISKKYQKATRLISFGSVANYAYQIKLKKEFQETKLLESLQKNILDKIPDPAIRVRLPNNSSEQVGRVLNYLSDYLGLVALVAIFLSGIGSSYLFQNYVFSKMTEVGVLKSLGMTLGEIKRLFIAQLLVLGTSGVIIAIGLSLLVLPSASLLLDELLSINVTLHVGFESIMASFFVGVFTIFVICYPILIKLVDKKTVEMFYAQSSFDWKWNLKDYLNYIPLLISLEALAVWQAHSIKVGTIFTLAVLFVVLLIAFLLPRLLGFFNHLIIKKSGSLSWPRSLNIGLAIRELIRSKLSTTLTFMSLSLGVMLLSLIGQLEVSLNKELLSNEQSKPSLFLFDIQMEQKQELVKFSRENKIPMMEPTPMVRSRILKLNGVDYKRDLDSNKIRTREEQRRTRFRNRGINLTYALKTNHSQTIVKGSEFSGIYQGEGAAEVSLETRYAKRLGIDIGDKITFDILGVEIEGIVTSLRKIRWNSFLPNFFITLQPGVLEDAPQSYLAAIKNVDFQSQLRFQDLIVDKFPNISMINVTELVSKIMNLFQTMSVAIKLMAFLCIVVGFFVIYAIIQNQLMKRNYDMALMKSFGSSSKSITKQFVVEYFIMSFTSSIIGSLFSIIVGNVISSLFFDGVWSFNFYYFLSIVVSMSLMTILVVYLATRGIYNQPAKQLLE